MNIEKYKDSSNSESIVYAQIKDVLIAALHFQFGTQCVPNWDGHIIERNIN
jgi:hypothetical protein